MKLRTNNLSLNLLIAIIFLITDTSLSLAMTGDSEQPIHIKSDTQFLDIQNNVVKFSGNVILMQGTIKINADKVIVTRPDGKQGKEIIDGYGNLATFYQVQDNNRLIKGQALHMHYELAKDLVILIGNAYLEQFGGNISSDNIAYLVKEQKMQAYSEKGKRVTAVLIPSQLQNKNKEKSR